MKSYIENINEITPDALLKGILGYGLFVEKVPSFLTSKGFYEFYINENKPVFEKKERDYVRYESIRNINIPRELAIPNPFAYANLCNCIYENWSNIQEHFNITSHETYKVSRIHLRNLNDKNHLFEMNYKNFEKDGAPEQDIIIRSRFRVDVDISSCFPSIYSHSIPWALVGKNLAKSTKNDKSHWYNILDFNIRNTKNGETNGLLIGPHPSNLLSEIILCVIDKKNAGQRL